MRGNSIRKNDLAKSFQDTVTDELVRKLKLAIENTGIKNIIMAGGVSANNNIRDAVKELCDNYDANFHVPKLLYCTDNAAMIGAAAYPLYLKQDFTGLDLNASAFDQIF